MNKTQFWQLIEASRADLSDDDVCDASGNDNLKAKLIELQLSADASRGNSARFIDAYLDAAPYRWDLWAVAYIIITAVVPTTALKIFLFPMVANPARASKLL